MGGDGVGGSGGGVHLRMVLSPFTHTSKPQSTHRAPVIPASAICRLRRRFHLCMRDIIVKFRLARIDDIHTRAHKCGCVAAAVAAASYYDLASTKRGFLSVSNMCIMRGGGVGVFFPSSFCLLHAHPVAALLNSYGNRVLIAFDCRHHPRGFS